MNDIIMDAAERNTANEVSKARGIDTITAEIWLFKQQAGAAFVGFGVEQPLVGGDDFAHQNDRVGEAFWVAQQSVQQQAKIYRHLFAAPFGSAGDYFAPSIRRRI